MGEDDCEEGFSIQAQTKRKTRQDRTPRTQRRISLNGIRLSLSLSLSLASLSLSLLPLSLSLSLSMSILEKDTKRSYPKPEESERQGE